MTEREALKLSLEALLHAYHEDEAHPKTLEAITAINNFLAQPEQEPVAWQLVFDDGHTEITTRPVANWKRLMWESAGKRWDTVPLYTTPPQRTWVGLTEEEINEVLGADIRDEPSGELRFIRAIEAKLKEKNP